jgi:hypothetical protein
MAIEDTLDMLNNTSIHAIADIPAWDMTQKSSNDSSHAKRTDHLLEFALQNMMTHKNRVAAMSECYVAKLCSNASSVDPIEAASAAKMFQGESDSSLNSLMAALSAGQIATKAAQSTPNETGVTQLIGQLNALTNQNSQNGAATQNMSQAMQVQMAAAAQILAKMAMTTPDVTGKSAPAIAPVS